MHPTDLIERGIRDGAEVEITTAVGTIRVTVRATDDVMEGVVCLPHGWGQTGKEGLRLRVADVQPGANFNVLSSSGAYDHPTGTTVLNGIPVSVRPVSTPL